jgi:hypothetical protein
MKDINSKSVMDSLLSNLLLDSQKEVNIEEKTFMSELSEPHHHEDGKDHFWDGFVWKYDKKRLFPLTRALFTFLWSCVMGLANLGYVLCETILRLITGRKFHLATSRRFNVVVCFSMLVICIILVIYMMVFLVKDVILFPVDSYSNTYGTLVMTQPCAVEKYVRVLSSNECWCETGIMLAEGDEVRITYSGNFYGEVADYKDAAEENRKPRYFDSDNNSEGSSQESGVGLCMYGYNGEADARFGSLLDQIKSETDRPVYRNENDSQKIFQIESKTIHSFTVEDPGTLMLSVNDIYLYNEDFLKKVIEHDGRYFQNLTDASAYIRNREILFADNLGEYLVNVEVCRNSFSDSRMLFGAMMKTYRWLYMDGNWKVLLCVSALFLVLDAISGVLVRWISRKKK